MQGQKAFYWEDLENKKSEIVKRFLDREKVQIYFDIIKSVEILNNDHLNAIKGIGEEVKNDITDLFEIYKIDMIYLCQPITINHTIWWYDMTPLSEDSLDFYLPLFFREFSLYPVSTIRISGLKFIYLTESLIFSTDSYSQYRAAVPDYTRDTMAMIYCCKERGIEYIKNVIHHEYFHFIDYMDDGIIYGSDPEWESLNKEVFIYGSGGANNRDWMPLNPAIKGFLNYYSTTGIEEDKAEVFSFMMTQPALIRNHPDEIILSKFKYILAMLESFDPDAFVNTDFWDWLKLLREAP